MTQKTFDENTLGSEIYSGYYAWSVAGNWTPSGEPASADNDDLTYTAKSANDQQVDDISSLDADSLTLATTASNSEGLYVAGDLTIGTLTLDSVGGNFATLEATDTFGTDPTVTIDGLGSGSAGTLLAYGAGAVIDVDASDPGAMTYESANGGLIELSGAPAATSTLSFVYDAAGILALAAPGETISAALTGVQAGCSIELPGTTVTNVIYGADAITIDTDVATYSFADVTYGSSAPTSSTGYYGTGDAATGLERIIFATPVWEDGAADANGYYRWSNAANWSGGLAPNGGTIALIGGLVNDRAYLIDEAELDLVSLTQQSVGITAASAIYVNGDVTIGSVDLLDIRNFIADTTIAGGATSATLTILDSLQVNPNDPNRDVGTTVGANGVGATVDVKCADSGGYYEATNGGVFILAGAPDAESQFAVDGTSTFEFLAPGSSIAAQLWVSGAGGSIELPGSSLVTASMTSNALTVTTNLGTYAFGDFLDTSGGPLWGLVATYDNATGLERVSVVKDADALSVAASGTGIVKGSGKVGVGATVTFTVAMSAAVTVDTSNGKPTLKLSDGGFATYAGGSGTNELTFTYTVVAGQNTSDLSILGYALNDGSILDPASDPVSLGGVVTNPPGTLRVAANPNQFADDYNDDGTSDVLWTAASGGAIDDWSIVGGAKTKSLALGTTPAGDKLVGTGDFNGDGTTDLLFQNATSGEVGEMDVSKGKAGATHTLVTEAPSTHWAIAAAGDFNGDGTSDILWRNSASGKVMVSMFRNDALFKSATMNGPGSGYAFLAVGDLNGDGTTDIVWENGKTHALVDWQMTGGNKHTSIAMGTSPTGESYVGVGHFLGTGSDQLLFESSTGALSAWRASAGKMVDKLNLGNPALPTNFAVAAIGDYNGDGRSDVMLYDKSDGQIDVGLLGGSGHIAAWAKVGTLSPTNWGFAG